MVKYLEWEPATYSRRAVPRSAARSAPLVAPFGAPSVFSGVGRPSADSAPRGEATAIEVTSGRTISNNTAKTTTLPGPLTTVIGRDRLRSLGGGRPVSPERVRTF
jgi:hypothetical protein